MAQVSIASRDKVSLLHDIMVELGRVEMQLERHAHGAMDESSCEALRAKHAKLHKAMSTLAA